MATVAAQSKPAFRRATEALRRWIGPRAFRAMSVYPPYLGANVRVAEASADATRFVVTMRLRFWNQNYFGTHFGGSLYSMCDPFFALILTENLGPDYLVWDKASTIRFLRPGRGTVAATFEIDRARLAAIRAEVDERGKADFTFACDVVGPEGERVAHVTKVLTVAKRSERSR